MATPLVQQIEAMSNVELDADQAAKSPLYQQMIFLVASPESGANLLLAALGRLPDVTAARVPTHLFSHGVARLFDRWVSGEDTDRPNGVALLVDEQDFLTAVRLMTDMVLEAVREDDKHGRIAEYSPEHILQTDVMAAMYPDAHIVHVVRDPRQVVARLASNVQGLSARDAADHWREDQEAVGFATNQDNIHLVRLEDLVLQPESTLHQLLDALELEVTAHDLEAAAAALHFEGHWVSEPLLPYPVAMAELLLGDLFDAYGYSVAGTRGREHRIAQFEVALYRALRATRDVAERGFTRLAERAHRVQAEPRT